MRPIRHLALTLPCLLLITIGLLGCGRQGTPTPTANDSASAAIGPEGGILTTPSSRAKLIVPVGALPGNTFITISKSTDRDPPGGIIGSYEFKPDDLPFNPFAIISFQYDPGSIPEGINEANLKLAYASGGEWAIVPNPTVDMVNHALSSQVTHLSKYSLASERLPYKPSGPEIGEYNSVKVYSNGSVKNVSQEYNSYGNIISGMKWQSVEYVNRYYPQVYGKNIRIPGTEAKDYYITATQRGLVAYSNDGSEPPRSGDIIVSEGDGNPDNVGHVAIVREVSADKIYVAQQNWCQNEGDIKFPLLRSANLVDSFGGSASYPIKGWIRLPETSVGTYSISGKVTESGAGLAGVTMSLTGATSASTTAETGGNYQFINIPKGTYTITPSKTGYSFNPSSRTLAVGNTNITGRIFEVTPSGGHPPNLNPLNLTNLYGSLGEHKLAPDANPTGNRINFDSFTDYQGNLVLGLSQGGRAFTKSSTDGYNWTDNNDTVPADKLLAMASNGSRIVGSGDASGDGLLMYSDDLETWHITTHPVSFACGVGETCHPNIRKILYANNIFVAVGDRGTIITSSDGITWTQRLTGITWVNFMQLTWSGSEFLIYSLPTSSVSPALGAYAPSYLFRSPDGINWTMQNLTALGVPGGVLVAHGGVIILARTGGYILSSTDGVTWTEGNFKTDFMNYWQPYVDFYDAAWVGSGYLLVGESLIERHKNKFYTIFYTSPDGVNWRGAEGISNNIYVQRIYYAPSLNRSVLFRFYDYFDTYGTFYTIH